MKLIDKNAVSQNNIQALAYNTYRSYELKNIIREAIKSEITQLQEQSDMFIENDIIYYSKTYRKTGGN